MSINIACEHFDLTEPVRNHLQDRLRAASEALTARAEITSATLSKVADREYRVVIKARAPGREIVATGLGEDVFSAITQSTQQFRRQARAKRAKRVALRRGKNAEL